MFDENIERRMNLFDCLVKGIIFYGAEMWGWEEIKELEAVQIRYLKWMLELDKWTPGYIVRDECKRKKLRIETGMRAVKYEEKIRKNTKSKLLQELIRDLDKNREEVEGRWLESRRKYWERCGWSGIEVKNMRDSEVDIVKEMKMRDDDVLHQEELSEIEKSRYNKKYEYIRTTELPEYMKRPGKNNKHKIIARFRTGNEEEENKYWLKDRKRCRVCGEGEDSVEHMVMDKNWTWREVLEEDGGGERWTET